MSYKTIEGLEMKDTKAQAWWRRNLAIMPAGSTLIGLALGSLVGVLVAIPWFDRLSLFMGLSLAFVGGASGFGVWLSQDRVRAKKFWDLVNLITILATILLVLAFPDLWRQVYRGAGLLMCVSLVGAVCGACMVSVAFLWGMHHIACCCWSLCRSTILGDPGGVSNGIWDRELDLNVSIAKRNA